jgi:hypothetical protein
MPLFALIWVVMPSSKEKGTINLGMEIQDFNQTIFYGKKEMQEGNIDD